MNIPKPTDEQKRLMAELAQINSKGFKRFNIRKLFTDPRYLSVRRYIQTAGTMMSQAREGVDTNWNEVYSMSVKNEKL